MDIKQLEYFVQVVDAGSFTRAAMVLEMTQPSLSRQIRLLEVELHEHLLYRNGRGVEPTEAGRRLLEHARVVLDRLATARQEIHELKAVPRGKIVVGFPPRIAHLLAPSLVRGFRERLPGAALTVTEGLSVSLREWLHEGRVDVALLYDPAPGETLDYEPVFKEELMLVGSVPGPGERLPESLPVDALADYPLILPCEPNTIRAVVDAACRRRGIALDIVAEVNAVHTMVALAESGEGYALLSASAIGPQRRAGTLATARVHSPSMHNNLIMCTARLQPLTRLTRETMQLLRSLDIRTLLANA
ncbi:LysR substrate-binding domain-containing protein [Pigmentiphaga sp.]|uniref:LysR substrate-binding domain-containing protein n=1 Tax=Pigmentiphaga sp. TaxID=1977564 RepID=UPI00128BF7E1|nr:LysR substrate-binding domain-containing protein [Pigmentiphaga sp.]MPS30239.1 LysR family transcriptional regulator [Alcaligenaceae bacterium SAGV5]MPS50213.1 LysR family transcriptional regulator [Alcaligenaceae bacterium SAGV3]MPT55695.1 LysR family transcriptional regulator [Alcaligenaceae bacterium]